MASTNNCNQVVLLLFTESIFEIGNPRGLAPRSGALICAAFRGRTPKPHLYTLITDASP
jgi:hypothetical protein